MAKDLAVVLNNGSINSAVATALAAQKYRPIMLHIETSGLVASRSRAAYEQQVAHFKPYREHTVSMAFFSSLGSQVASTAQAADPRQGGLLAPQLLELVSVIGVAARYAAHYQAAAIYAGLRVGASAEELAQASEYVQIWNELIQLPCGQSEVEMMAPLLELEPWQVVDVGFQVSAPLDKSWNCVDHGSEPCGTCSGCKGRAAAFQQAGKPDPLRVMGAQPSALGRV